MLRNSRADLRTAVLVSEAADRRNSASVEPHPDPSASSVGPGDDAGTSGERAADFAGDHIIIRPPRHAHSRSNRPEMRPALWGWIRAVVPAAGLALVAVLITNFAAHVNNPSYPTDDGYIAFSYARTFAVHGTLALTPGVAPVQGFSDFLWVFLLAAAHLVGLSIPTASRFLGVACVVAIIPATYVLARRMAPDAWRGFPLAAAIVVGFLPGEVFFAVSGLETTLATLLLTVAVMDLVRGGPADADAPLPWIGDVALLGYGMVRPEGIVMWGALTVIRFGSLRSPHLLVSLRRLGPWLGAFLIPFAVYLVWQLWYFGSLIPNTVTAKEGTPMGIAIRQAIPYLYGFFVPLGVFTVLAVIGALRRQRSSAIAACALSVLVAFTLLAAVQDGYPYQRYLLEGAPVMLALSSAGAWRMTAWLTSRNRFLGAFGTLVLLALAFVGVQREFAASPYVSFSQITAGRPFDSSWGQFAAADRGPHATVYPGYHSAAAWLRQRAQPGESIALEEIGIISYYSGLQVIDTFGLADATIARQPGSPSDKVDIPYLLKRRPTFWAMPIHGNCLCVTLLGDVTYSHTPTFEFGYNFAGAFPSGSNQVAIFRRRPGLVAVESLDSELTDRVQFVGPPSLAALPTGPVVTVSEQTAVRYALAGSLIGVVGTPWPSGNSTTLIVDVPKGVSTSFEVGTGPVGASQSGTWTLSAVAAAGSTSVAVSTTATRTAAWEPTDLSVPLTEWRGKKVVVTLTYAGISPPSPAAVTFVEPRLVLTAP